MAKSYGMKGGRRKGMRACCWARGMGDGPEGKRPNSESLEGAIGGEG